MNEEQTKEILKGIHLMYQAFGAPDNFLALTFRVSGIDYKIWIHPDSGDPEVMIQQFEREIDKLREEL